MPGYITPTNSPGKAYSFDEPSKILVSVTGPGTAYLGHSPQECLSKIGPKFVQGDNKIPLDWQGDLWVLMDDPLTVCNLDNLLSGNRTSSPNPATAGFGDSLSQPSGSAFWDSFIGSAIARLLLG